MEDEVCYEPDPNTGFKIIDEFNRAYEDRLAYVDKEIGDDCAELKYPIYRDWVRDLRAQNKAFIQVLEKLEYEAGHRFKLLEAKLKNDTRIFGGETRTVNEEPGTVSAEPRAFSEETSRFTKLANDVKNLVELIHRALETNKWDCNNLEFQTITVEDIFGKYLKNTDSDSVLEVNSSVLSDSKAEKCIKELKAEMIRLTCELNRKDCVIDEYQGRIRNLQLDYNPSCDSIEARTDLEDKFKTYIEELKHIIKEKDAKNLLLNKENENLKQNLCKNVENNSRLDKETELNSETKETEPSEAQSKSSNVNCNDLDSGLEKCDRVKSDISVFDRLNQEISDLLVQIRARESHICNQNSIICNFQEKLNETRLQLKLITCERDQLCKKLSIIECEVEKIRDDIMQCPGSPKSKCDNDTENELEVKSEYANSPSCEDGPDDNRMKEKKSVILNLKPMVNNMREKIVTLNRENGTLKEDLSDSQCTIVCLKNQITALNNKSCADKEVLVNLNNNNNADSSAETEYHDADEHGYSIGKIKREKASIQHFKSIFKEFLCKFGVDVDECDLDRLAHGDKKTIDKLIAYIKKTLQSEIGNTSCESNTDICHLKDVLNSKESEIYDLTCKLTSLNVEAENNCQTPSSDDDLTLLSEQLNCYFEDNMKMERQIDLIRDENLELKRQLFDLESDYASLEMQQQTDYVVTNRREKSIYKLLKKDLDQLKKQSTTIQSSLCNRESELKKLKYFRDKCLEMEINCRSELEMQKSHYTKIINELHEELASLSDQLAEQQKESLQQNDLINDTSALENSISEIENQNDILQKTLCSYECRLVDSEDKCNKLKIERKRLECKLDCYKSEVDEKDKQICELKLEIDKLKSRDNYPTEDNNQNVCNRPVSSSGYDSSRALDIIKRLNCEIQNVKKSALEDKNCLTREIDEYCAQIGKLKNKICCLENLTAKREKEVESLNEKMSKNDKRTCQLEDDLYAKTSRITHLEREDFKLREIVNKLSLQLSESKKETHCNEKHLISELNCYKEKVDEQKKVIKSLKQQYDKSHDDVKNIKSLEESFNKEKSKLMREICNANERIAAFEEHDSQISNLVYETQQDLQREKDEVNRLKQIEHEFCKMREQNCKIYQHNCEMTKKLKKAECEYEKLAVEYKKLLDVKEQALAALKTARAWQTENCEREKLIKLKLQKNTEHIQTLTTDRKQLISKMNQMHRDEIILRSEIDVLKEKLAHCRCSRRYAFTDTENSGSTFTRVDRYSSDPEVNNDDQDDRCLKSVKHTAKKIYRTRKFWQNGIKDVCE